MWLYVPTPSPASPPAPEEADWISPLNWRSQALALSCTWRGKHSPPRTWSRRLKRVSWLRRLSTAMPEPSQADDFVASWISSTAASLASLTPLLEPNSARPTAEISGRRADEPSSSRAPGRSSSRTSPACSTPVAPSAYGVSFDALASTWRQDCSRRARLARPTSDSASSSSGWPTPFGQLHNDGEDPVSFHARRALLKEKHGNGNGAGLPLAVAAKTWATPVAADSGEKVTLVSSQNRCLLREAAFWSTPAVADVEGGRKTRSGSRSGELLLNGQAIRLSSLQDPETSPPGATSSSAGLTLNPLFVETLMSWPPGLTLVLWAASTAYACSETAFTRWKVRMRSELSRLGLPPAPQEPRNLFDGWG